MVVVVGVSFRCVWVVPLGVVLCVLVVVCWDADGRTLRLPPNLIFWAPVPCTASLSTAGVAGGRRSRVVEGAGRGAAARRPREAGGATR